MTALHQVTLIARDIQVTADSLRAARSYARSDALEFLHQNRHEVASCVPHARNSDDDAEPTLAIEDLSIEAAVVAADEDGGMFTCEARFDVIVAADTADQAAEIALKTPFRLKFQAEIQKICQAHGLEGQTLWSRDPGLVAVVNDAAAGRDPGSVALQEALGAAGWPVLDVHRAEWEPMAWERGDEDDDLTNEEVYVFTLPMAPMPADAITAEPDMPAP